MINKGDAVTFRDQLEALDACEEALEWVGDRDLYAAWAECERGDWLLWLAARVLYEDTRVLLAACDCAESYILNKMDDAPLAWVWAIDATRRYAQGETAIDEVEAAWDANQIALYEFPPREPACIAVIAAQRVSRSAVVAFEDIMRCKEDLLRGIESPAYSAGHAALTFANFVTVGLFSTHSLGEGGVPFADIVRSHLSAEDLVDHVASVAEESVGRRMRTTQGGSR